MFYAMFIFIGFFFSLLKEIYNTCAIHTQKNRRASVAHILFVGFFEIFSKSINKNNFRCTNENIKYKNINKTKHNDES